MSKPNQGKDPPEILDAIAALSREKIPFSRPNRWQLKIGDLSYYPTQGSICRDGDDGRLPEHGLDSFLTLLAPRRKPPQRPLDPETSAPPTIDFSTLPPIGWRTISGALIR